MDMMFEDAEIDFLKRRNVEWITNEPLKRSKIDPLIIPIIYSHGAVVSANNYSSFINRTLFPNYYRGGAFHSILRIEKKIMFLPTNLTNFLTAILNYLIYSLKSLERVLTRKI